jgi:hypothetical protein
MLLHSASTILNYEILTLDLIRTYDLIWQRYFANKYLLHFTTFSNLCLEDIVVPSVHPMALQPKSDLGFLY